VSGYVYSGKVKYTNHAYDKVTEYKRRTKNHLMDQIESFRIAASQKGVPLTVLDLDAPDAQALYREKLVLVRPDQHVAWRGDSEPPSPAKLIDIVRGAGVCG
jgi:hypothetical protein